jgi:hypothetical protein
MNLTDLIEKARELIGGGGVDALGENAGELSDIVQGEGSVGEKAEQAVDSLGDSGGDAGDAAGDASGGSQQR